MLAILLILCKFTISLILEERIDDIARKAEYDIRRITIHKRAIDRLESIELRPSAKGGSIVILNSPDPNEEWAYEFSINHINLAFPQHAGLYLYYTNDPLIVTVLKGDHSPFHDIMASIEFLERSIDLVHTSNEGYEDFTGTEDVTETRYSIKPERFRDKSVVRVNVINPNRNFKMKIYDRDKPDYDRLRFMDSSDLWGKSLSMHSGLAATHDEVLFDRHFIQRQVQLSYRTEEVAYDPFLYEYEYPAEEGGTPDATEHSPIERQDLITNRECNMLLMNTILGEPIRSNLMQSIMDTMLENIWNNFRIDKIKLYVEKLKRIYSQANASEFWDIDVRSDELMKDRNILKDFIVLYRNLEADRRSMSGGLLRYKVIGMLRLLLIVAVKAAWFKKEPVKLVNKK
ncbi:MAG: hypothetical protein ACRCX2_02035 [Paraclostridium sp.]